MNQGIQRNRSIHKILSILSTIDGASAKELLTRLEDKGYYMTSLAVRQACLKAAQLGYVSHVTMRDKVNPYYRYIITDAGIEFLAEMEVRAKP